MSGDGPPDECPNCGSDIDVRRDTGVYAWNWSCPKCMAGDYKLAGEVGAS